MPIILISVRLVTKSDKEKICHLFVIYVTTLTLMN